MTTTEQQTWAAAAKCRGMGDAPFSDGTDVKRMRQFCRIVPSRSTAWPRRWTTASNGVSGAGRANASAGRFCGGNPT